MPLIALWSGLALPTAQCQEGQTEPKTGQTAPALPPSLRIVKLLWKAQPKGAATSLEKALDQAITRGETQSLHHGIESLADSFRETVKLGSNDSRYVAGLAALALIGDAVAVREVETILAPTSSVKLALAQKQLLLRCWSQSSPDKAKTALRAWLSIPLNETPETEPTQRDQWLEVLAQTGLQADRDAFSKLILSRWSQWPRGLQVALIEPFSQQPTTMKLLVAEIERGKIAKDLLNTNQLRKWSDSQDHELATAIERVWGKLRAGEDEDRKAVVMQTMKLLTANRTGDPVAGEQTFKRICIQCHRLHGEGFDVGPDITSNGRGSFEQLVSNVMDPSLVIGKAFLAKTVLTQDGRVLAGIVAAEDDKRLTLKVQGGKLVELDREDDIEEIKESSKSLMPDGLEKQMSEQELLNLFAYLSLARPLTAAENETIPGTPARLVP